MDIRNIFPEMDDEINYFGDISKIIKSKKQYDYLKENGYIYEYGYDGQIQYLKMGRLFTIEDVKNRIEEICKECK